MIDSSQELFIEALQFLVQAFFGAPAQKDRRPDPAPFKLPFVEEPGSRNGRRGKRDRLFLAA